MYMVVSLSNRERRVRLQCVYDRRNWLADWRGSAALPVSACQTTTDRPTLHCFSSLYVSLCLSMSVSLPVSLLVLCVYPVSISLHVCVCPGLCVCLCVRFLSILTTVCLSVCLSLSLSVCVFLCCFVFLRDLFRSGGSRLGIGRANRPPNIT